MNRDQLNEEMVEYFDHVISKEMQRSHINRMMLQKEYKSMRDTLLNILSMFDENDKWSNIIVDNIDNLLIVRLVHREKQWPLVWEISLTIQPNKGYLLKLVSKDLSRRRRGMLLREARVRCASSSKRSLIRRLWPFTL